MSDNVVEWGGISRLDLPPERVLTKALDGNLTSVVILGHTEDGDEYFASSLADGGDVLWLLERCKKLLLDVPD